MSTEMQNAPVNSFRRYVESAAFIAVWMMLGWLVRLDNPAYIILGVPLLALFQLVVRRQPLRQLWVRDPERPLRMDRWGVTLGLLFMATPAYFLTLALSQRLWVE